MLSYEMIMKKLQTADHDILKNMLEWLAQGENRAVSLFAVMTWLCETIQSGLWLTDSSCGRTLFAYELTDQSAAAPAKYTAINFKIKKTEGKIWHLCLYANRELSPDVLEKAAEAIRFYILLWDDTCLRNDEDALLQAIIQDNPFTSRQLAHRLGIDFNLQKDLWVLRFDTEKRLEDITNAIGSARNFFSAASRQALIGSYERSVFILMNRTVFSELDEGMERELLNHLSDGTRVYLFHSICSMQEIKNAYDSILRNEKAARQIYHQKTAFTRHDLQFAGICREILSDRKETAQELTGSLSCVCTESEDLLRTLSVYYLDADGNAQKTGEFLYMHNNTVKYRLHKIRQILGMDITRMPANYNIYLSLALKRIQDASEKNDL